MDMSTGLLSQTDKSFKFMVAVTAYGRVGTGNGRPAGTGETRTRALAP
jgi:hypothetical protein